MERKTVAAISAIAFLAVFIRIFPTFSNFAVGNDFGIYNTIIRDFALSGKIFSTYKSPWGGAGYGDFPVMYWIIIGLWKLTGLNYTELLVRVPPIFGGLTSVIIYLIAWKITGNRIVSLISALFDAVNPVIVFQTSISSILVFGHFFGLLTILFLLCYAESYRYLIPAVFSGFVLVMAHPLSTFMYLIAATGIVLVSLYRDSSLRERIRFALFLYPVSIFTFVYWYFFFPGFQQFLSAGILHLPGSLVMGGFFALVTIVLAFPFRLLQPHVRKFDRFRRANSLGFLKGSLAIYGVSIGIGFPLMVKLLPSFTVLDGLSMIPVVLNGALAIVGMSLSRGRARIILTGWLLLLGSAFLYSLATWNTVLYPGRYFEYLFEPLSILEGIAIYSLMIRLRSSSPLIDGSIHPHLSRGIGYVREGEEYLLSHMNGFARNVRASTRVGYHTSAGTLAIIGIILVVCTASAATPYQVGKIVTPSGNQSISIPDYHAAQWLLGNASQNYSVATDHILGLMVDSYNQSGTFEDIHYLWNESSVNTAMLQEMMGNSYNRSSNYTPVGYVLIDNFMLYNGVWGYDGLSNPYAKPIVMSNMSFFKFFSEPFVPVYFNYSLSTSWAIVFAVNWTYIDVTYGLHIPNGNLVHVNTTYSMDSILNRISVTS